ncbi:hypothetical protein [Dickeya poaceiphila]|uniref:Uncharacterized protein n=1 Tax=Dickeya poaceiphila TaxID=568768 RepID=A0A5B8HRC4_9GAMM|nr:hypothetical protein [Dickeya poaceiphila]QDX31149.1 hypothetical protein Dpoa569_0003134 [Dickeya poaceiphila]
MLSLQGGVENTPYFPFYDAALMRSVFVLLACWYDFFPWFQRDITVAMWQRRSDEYRLLILALRGCVWAIVGIMWRNVVNVIKNQHTISVNN